jgi:hypothetical protein
MACSGAHCTNHGTGTTTCAGHRASCATNRPLVSSSFATAGQTITAQDIDNLKTLINAEITRYRQHSSFSTATQSSSTISNAQLIVNSHINEFSSVVQSINNITEPVGTSFAVRTNPPDLTTPAQTYSKQSTIEDTDWSGLRDRYNTMRQDCICNADCACNLVCNCHNDCGCNYSDIRLKQNIEFVETKNDLKIYTWNYIWDKTKRYTGVIAQELLNTKFSSAVSVDSKGFYKVDYSKLPI